MCLSIFMNEMFRYESPWRNQGPLKRTLASGVKHYIGSVHPRKGVDGASMPTFDQNIDNLLYFLNCTVSEQSDECASRRRDQSSTHRQTVNGVLSVRGQFSCTFELRLKQLIMGFGGQLWIKQSLINLINPPYKDPNPIKSNDNSQNKTFFLLSSFFLYWKTLFKTSQGRDLGSLKGYFTVNHSSTIDLWDLIHLLDLFPQRVPSKFFRKSSFNVGRSESRKIMI